MTVNNISAMCLLRQPPYGRQLNDNVTLTRLGALPWAAVCLVYCQEEKRVVWRMGICGVTVFLCQLFCVVALRLLCICSGELLCNLKWIYFDKTSICKSFMQLSSLFRLHISSGVSGPWFRRSSPPLTLTSWGRSIQYLTPPSRFELHNPMFENKMWSIQCAETLTWICQANMSHTSL